MSQKAETTFYTGVNKHLDPNLWREKMNNPFRGGTWDFWYSGRVADLWVEYKFIILPKRDDTMITFDLSALQLQWGAKAYARFRQCRGDRKIAVIVGCKEGGAVLTDLMWETRMPCKKFKKLLCSRLEIATRIVQMTGGAP